METALDYIDSLSIDTFSSKKKNRRKESDFCLVPRVPIF